MTQGKPLAKSADGHAHAWILLRKKDTLHLLVLLLRHEADARGDSDTVRLIDDTLSRLGEGDGIKFELVGRMREKGDGHDEL